jgi:hypothetical protein
MQQERRIEDLRRNSAQKSDQAHCAQRRVHEQRVPRGARGELPKVRAFIEFLSALFAAQRST